MKRIFWVLFALALLAASAACAEATPGEAQEAFTAKVAIDAPLCSVQGDDGMFARLAVGEALEVTQVGSCWCRVRSSQGEGFVPTINLCFGEGEAAARIAIVNAAAGSTAVPPDGVPGRAEGAHQAGPRARRAGGRRAVYARRAARPGRVRAHQPADRKGGGGHGRRTHASGRPGRPRARDDRQPAPGAQRRLRSPAGCPPARKFCCCFRTTSGRRSS